MGSCWWATIRARSTRSMRLPVPSSGKAALQHRRMRLPPPTELLMLPREEESWSPLPLPAADRRCAARYGRRRRRGSRCSHRQSRTASSMSARSTSSTRRVTCLPTRPRVLTDAALATLVLGGANETPVAVAGGRVYATTVNGAIDSFGLPQ